MLTPVFELVDHPNHLCIIIKAPYTKVSDAEVFIDGCEFKFYSKPYYLRLNLPGPLVENGNADAKYDADSGTFTITAPKETPGQIFEGLDLLTKLLAPVRQKGVTGPGIEVIGATAETQPSCSSQSEKDDETGDSEEEFDWQIEQEVCVEQEVGLDAPHYGFAGQKSGVFRKLQEELSDVIDLREADSIPQSERQALRCEKENEQFDEDYYLADLFENEFIGDILKFTPPWSKMCQSVQLAEKNAEKFEFTDDEKEQLLQLPRKEYLISPSVQQSTLLGLVDILFGYAYNYRTTEGDSTVESAWTVCKLSATLSWLQTYSSLPDVVVTSYRRALCYPLYRHWGLNETVMADVQQIISLGKRMVLRCLLDFHKLLLSSENYYLINDLYIADYCVWIQSVKEKHFKSLVENLAKVKITKASLQFDLDVIEQAGKLALQEEEEETADIEQDLGSLSIQQERDNIKDGSLVGERHESSDGDSSDSSETDSSTESGSSNDDSDDDLGTTELIEQTAEQNSDKLITEISETLHEQSIQDYYPGCKSDGIENTKDGSSSCELGENISANIHGNDTKIKENQGENAPDHDPLCGLPKGMFGPDSPMVGEKGPTSESDKLHMDSGDTVGTANTTKDCDSLNF